MKIVLSVDAIKPLLTGIGRYTWELAQQLPLQPGIERVRYHKGGQWLDNPATLLGESQGGRGPKAFKWPSWVRRLYWSHAFRGQIYHGTNYFLPPQVECGVVTVHDLSVLKYPETHPVKRVKDFERYFRSTLERASYLITDSETTRQEVIANLAWPAARVSAVPLGVSAAFHPRDEDVLMPHLQRLGVMPGRYALCVSTIEPRKRLDALLIAYSRLPASLLEVYPLILVGSDGWQNEHLHDLITRGQREGWLRYWGFVPENDLPALYAGARLFVYLSMYEGFGLPVAEAMTSGIPLVASNRSCLPEITGGAAQLVDPDDMDLLPQVLEAALLDTTWRTHAIEKGLEIAARYRWDVCARNTVAVYNYATDKKVNKVEVSGERDKK